MNGSKKFNEYNQKEYKMSNLLEEAKMLSDVIVKNRRYIHENAETHNNLPITTTYVSEKLIGMGYAPVEICQSGIVALAGGKKPGKTFLLRADMDALPIVEENELKFKSITQNMHACGHDMHTSMLLGAAQLLKNHEDEIEGTVKLMFQPAEETLWGANAMIEAGVLDNPKVDAAMMIHVASGIPVPTGTIAIPEAGVVSAAADWFEIKIAGKGGHGAMPNMAVDPINVLAHIHTALQEINSREIAPGENVALTIGQIRAGNTSNVIPDTGFMSGTIRTYSNDVREFIKNRLTEIATGIASSFRATAEVVYTKGCPCLTSDEDLTKQIFKYSKELFGEDRVIDMSKLTGGKKMSGSEDFAFISELVPTVMVSLGAGSIDEGYLFPLHHPKASFNENALSTGAAMYANTAIEWLKNNK